MIAALRNGFRTPPALRGFAAGLHLGTCGIAWMWWFIANWGTSPPVAAAMILVAGSACVSGLLPRPDDGRSLRTAHREAALRLACLATWTIILPALMSWSLSTLRWVPLTALSSAAMPFCLALVAATVTLGPALYFAGRLAGPLDVHASRDGAPTTIRPSVLSGIAVALCVVAWLVREPYPHALIPLMILGILVFFSARQEADRLHDHDQDDGVFGYDFSQGYTSLDRHVDAATRRAGPGPLRRWLENRRNLKRRRQREIEEDEERRVDGILAQIRETGMETISDQDRALLNRVSARYRNRSK